MSIQPTSSSTQMPGNNPNPIPPANFVAQAPNLPANVAPQTAPAPVENLANCASLRRKADESPAEQQRLPPKRPNIVVTAPIEVIDLTESDPPPTPSTTRKPVGQTEYGRSLIRDELNFHKVLMRTLLEEKDTNKLHLRVVAAIEQIERRESQLWKRLIKSEETSKEPLVTPPPSPKLTTPIASTSTYSGVSSGESVHSSSSDPSLPPSPFRGKPKSLALMCARRRHHHISRQAHEHTICRHCDHACFYCQLWEENNEPEKSKTAWIDEVLGHLIQATAPKKLYKDPTKKQAVTEAMKQLRYQMHKLVKGNNADCEWWYEEYAWIRQVLGLLEDIAKTGYPLALKSAVRELKKQKGILEYKEMMSQQLENQPLSPDS